MHALSCVLVACTLAAQDPFERFRASLPRVEGEAVLDSLREPVEVRRDALGVAEIRGTSFEDVVRAEGFVHAQERFFQMDAARRLASGRLAEIGGPAVVGFDRANRPYRFESLAHTVFERLPEASRALLEAYAQGVNAGLANLGAAPPEYAALGLSPEPWRAEDAILVQSAMTLALEMSARMEQPRGVMAATLPPQVFDFLLPATTRFDVPLIGGAEYRPAPIPPPDVVDLRASARRGVGFDEGALAGVVEPAPLGSNNWAIAGSRTAHGGAIVANDPHLQLSAPGIWYRVQLQWGRSAHGGAGDWGLAGASLPGTPGIVIGSNGRLAWGFTNSMVDLQDLVVIEVEPDRPDHYITEDGSEPFEIVHERIDVRGATPIDLELRVTRWGVVTDTDWLGRPLALRWPALDPAAVNLAVLEFALAGNVEDGVAIARRWHGPAQNVVLADDSGRIAWVVSGWLPKRSGFDGRIPVSWAQPAVGWTGACPESERPVVVDPESGVLFTANNRTVDAAWAGRLGYGWDLGGRAHRIAELLRGAQAVTEESVREMQLDLRLELYDFYRDLAIRTAAEHPDDTDLAEGRAAIERWRGTAATDEVGLVILDQWRNVLQRSIVRSLVAPCRKADPDFELFELRLEEPVRRVLEERPDHLVPMNHATWETFLASTLSVVVADLRDDGDEGVGAPWGSVNRTRIKHPLTVAVPLLGSFLDMPEAPLDGHRYAVRVATPSYGASLRFVASPGREENGFLQIPAGQSGHPLSPHYRDSHRAWLDGAPTPLLAGDAVTTLRLVPF